VLESYNLVYLDRVTNLYFAPIASLYQQKRKQLLIDFFNSKKGRRNLNRYFAVANMNFVIFEKLYSLLYSVYSTVLQIHTWSNSQEPELILYFKISVDSAMVIKFASAIIMVEFSGVNEETEYFHSVTNMLRAQIKTQFCRVNVSEMVECVCGQHTHFLEDLFGANARPLPAERFVTCASLGRISVANLAPDLNLPALLSYHDRYVASEVLGKGAFGIVRVARLVEDGGVTVAVKKFIRATEDLDSSFANFEAFSSFQYEALIGCHLSNKYILRQLGVDVPELSIIQELAPFGTLGDLLHKPVPGEARMCEALTIHQQKRFCRDMAHALAYLHSHRPPVIHRDIRSFNIFIFSTNHTADVCIKIGDFGLSTYSYYKLNEPLETWQWYVLFVCFLLFVLFVCFFVWLID
jgi:hypothetical protein